jgi:molybdopterin/thiamine biosynthesis adenylyltransferase
MSIQFGRGVPDRQSRARRAGYDPGVLQEATVIVVGAGALGQNVLLDLGLSGVRELRIVDGDVFEDHNLTRSPLFPGGAAGASKAKAVGEELARLHTAEQPLIRIADAWIEELGLGAFDGVDAIVACVDSLQARAYLAKVALLLGLPIVDGGFSGANVGMTAYPHGEEPTAVPCWRCGGPPIPGTFSCRQFAEFAASAGVVPAIQNGAATLGGLVSEAVVMLLHGKLTTPKRVSLDIRTGESLVFRPEPSPTCASGHRVLAKPVRSRLGANATVSELLEEHGDGPDPLLFLPHVFVERAPCPGCHATCGVDAPAHAWGRDPHCRECGGPWRPLTSGNQGQDVFSELDAGHPRAGEALASLGICAGDIVEIHGESTTTVRLGGAAGIWDEIG